MMHDYYALYTWAMDKQLQMEREATQRRLVRHSRYVNTHENTPRLRWPLARRNDERKAA
jgi:hypothetical protein